MLTYPEALDRVLLTIQPLPCEELPLPEALGRTLAETVTAAWDMPPADNSAMDGYAFALGDRESQAEWRVIGLARAGVGHCGEVPAAAAVKIMTGAPLPAGCDTVAPLETVEQLPDGSIRLRERLRQGDHVRCRGEEFRQGEALLAAGTPLKAGAIGLLAAAGVTRVRVHRRPRVALLTTGDELVDLGVRPGPGQIVNSNRYLLTARLQEEGAEVWPLEIAGDSRQELSARLAEGLQADLLLTTGGVSMGEYDLVKECLGELDFQLGFWKVAIKPGKPVLFGTARGTPVFGLPGNPAAAAATFELFARPALRRLAGDPAPHPRRCRASLACGVRGAGNRQSFLWGRVEESQGHYLFTPSSRQGSGQMRGLQGAQALLPLAADGPDLAAGSEVELLLIYLP